MRGSTKLTLSIFVLFVHVIQCMITQAYFELL